MTDVTSTDRVDIHDDLTHQIREIQLISDLMISVDDISEDTVNGLGTMLYRIASNAADLAQEAWKLGGAK